MPSALSFPPVSLPVAERFNLVRWCPRGDGGLVESLFLKLHLPELHAAFWARYSLARPLPGHGDPAGALWAVWSDPSGPPVGGRDGWPVSEVATGRERFYLRIGPGELSMGRAAGRVAGGGGIEWDLTFETGSGSLVHFPFESMYSSAFPPTKAVSPHVSTRFYGTVRVGGRVVHVDGARGMQGHNWGPRHSDHYVWCHANVFDGGDDAVFEAVSSELRLGPVSLPSTTLMYLRARGREVLLNRPLHLLRNRSRLDGMTWEFSGTDGGVRLGGRAWVEPDLVAGLEYVSSDGSVVPCVNGGMASLRIHVMGLPGGPLDLLADHTATVELSGRAVPRGVPVILRG